MDEPDMTYIADHELAMLLKAAADAGKRIRVEAGGETYEIEVNPPSAQRSIWDGYDPEAARAAWLDMAGILPDIDADAWIEQIKADRVQDTPNRKFP